MSGLNFNFDHVYMSNCTELLMWLANICVSEQFIPNKVAEIHLIVQWYELLREVHILQKLIALN